MILNIKIHKQLINNQLFYNKIDKNWMLKFLYIFFLIGVPTLLPFDFLVDVFGADSFDLEVVGVDEFEAFDLVDFILAFGSNE